MNSVLNERDIITLEGNQTFFVSKCVNHNNENYAFLCKIDDSGKPTKDFVVANEKAKGEKLFLEILNDEKEIDPILRKIQDSIIADMDKNFPNQK